MNEREQFEKAIATASGCNRPNSSDYFVGEFNLTVFAECLAQPAQEPVGWIDNDGFFLWDYQRKNFPEDTDKPLYAAPPSEAARIKELEEDLQDLRTQVNYRCADVQRLEAKLAECEKDAERYRFLKPNYAMANFDIYDSENGDEKVCGIIFEMPKIARFSSDLDNDLDILIADKG